jgi:hypothetical protein
MILFIILILISILGLLAIKKYYRKTQNIALINYNDNTQNIKDNINFVYDTGQIIDPFLYILMRSYDTNTTDKMPSSIILYWYLKNILNVPNSVYKHVKKIQDLIGINKTVYKISGSSVNDIEYYLYYPQNYTKKKYNYQKDKDTILAMGYYITNDSTLHSLFRLDCDISNPDQITMPVSGTKTYITSQDDYKFTIQNNVVNALSDIKIKFPDIHTELIISCNKLAIFSTGNNQENKINNKNWNNISNQVIGYEIVYIGISIDVFISFLKVIKKYALLVDNVEEHKDKLDALVNDVSIMYDMEGNIIDSAIWGIF